MPASPHAHALELAVCVLGCRVGSPALARRVRAARDAFRAQGAALVVACGGRRWDGQVEADAMARMLRDGGVPEEAIVRERASLDTRSNAREAALLLAHRGVRDVVLVTCTWHLPRARRLFERAGLHVRATAGAPPPDPTWLQRAYWLLREQASSWKDHLSPLALVALVVALVVPQGACEPKAAPAADAGVDAGASFDAASLARAEDLRRAEDVPAEVRTSHDVAARRRSARALARIADAASVDPLAGHLADDDPEVAAWAAYGLGFACKGREDTTVRALAARAASVGATPPAEAPSRAEPDLRTSIARAIGRCAGPLSEPVLVQLLGARGAWTDPALLGLGDLATRRKTLGADAITALLEAASEATKGPPHDLAFYALGRADGGELAGRVAEAARVALGRPGEARILAIRALGRAGKEGAKESAGELGRIVTDAKGFDVGERAEAARALAGLGDAGLDAIVAAIATLTPDAKDSIALAELAGRPFHVLHTLLGPLGAEPPLAAVKRAEAALNVLANLTPPAEPRPGFARRLADLRCGAALALARGAFNAEILQRCAPEGSEPWERARLAALLRRPIARERVAVFRALAKSEHLRVREAAVEGLAAHPEAGEAGAQVIAEALATKHAGLVATAAELLHAHPERALVLAASEKRAALDPRLPPPTATPAQEVAPAVGAALGAAIAAPWPADRSETRIALFEAAASLHFPKAKELATEACGDPNAVVRERAQKVLRTLGAPVAACEARPRQAAPAAEIGATLAGATKLALTTDAGELAITLEPDLAPVTATRLAALARSGFYDGVVVHRVVPGFVVQLGDPEGDGYGGSGTSLRCETSPVPFGPGDVGMALAGRDTGSSQFFVTLARTPHLDGEYTRVGRAEGDWASVAEGDVITGARLVE